MRRLVGVILAATLVGGAAAASPDAWASSRQRLSADPPATSITHKGVVTRFTTTTNVGTSIFKPCPLRRPHAVYVFRGSLPAGQRFVQPGAGGYLLRRAYLRLASGRTIRSVQGETVIGGVDGRRETWYFDARRTAVPDRHRRLSYAMYDSIGGHTFTLVAAKRCVS